MSRPVRALILLSCVELALIGAGAWAVSHRHYPFTLPLYLAAVLSGIPAGLLGRKFIQQISAERSSGIAN